MLDLASAFHASAIWLLDYYQQPISTKRIAERIGADRRNYSSAVYGKRRASLDTVAEWVMAWNKHDDLGELILEVSADGAYVHPMVE